MHGIDLTSLTDPGPLLEATVLNLNWTGEERFTAAEVVATPELRHYTEFRPERGDIGVVAWSGGESVGVAWAQVFGADDPGYGFVDSSIPEVSVCVWPVWRGRGVGTVLLEEMVVRARRLVLPGLSLSVESPNPAERLYRRLGFEPVESAAPGTMLLRLDHDDRASAS